MHPREDFYTWALEPYKNQLYVPPGEKHSSFMTLLQHKIFQQVWHTPKVGGHSPFHSTLHAPFRMSTHSTEVPVMVEKIQRISDWREIPDILALLHAAGVSVLFTLQFDTDLRQPENQLLMMRSTEPLSAPHKPLQSYMKALYRAFRMEVPHFSVSHFEQTVFSKLPSGPDLQSTLKSFNPVSILDVHHGLIWMKYYFLPHKIEECCVDNIPFFESIGQHIQSLPLHRWKSYLTFMWLHHCADLFSDTYLLYHTHVDRVLYNISPIERTYHLVEKASQAWWQDASRQYVLFNEEALEPARQLVAHMTQDLRDTLQTIFEQANWDEDTRDHAIKKLSHMKVLLGWSESNPRSPECKSTSFDQGILEGYRYQYQLTLSEYDKPTNRDQWRYLACNTVNAYYSRFSNVVYIPAALLHVPFVKVDSCHAYNFGGMGSIVAHEIYHAFDFGSKHVDSTGKLSNWWTKRDRDDYMLQAKRLEALYSRDLAISDHHKIDSSLTLSENIADLLALDISWRAFLLRCPVPSREEAQKFFVSFAVSQAQMYVPGVLHRILQNDSHATAMARVNIPLSTFEPFLKLYHVTPRDPMYTKVSERPHFLQSESVRQE